MKTTLIFGALFLAAVAAAVIMCNNARNAPTPDWYVQGSIDRPSAEPTPQPIAEPRSISVRGRVASRDADTMKTRIQERAAVWANDPGTEVQALSISKIRYRINTDSGTIAAEIIRMDAGDHRLTPEYPNWPPTAGTEPAQPDGPYEITLVVVVIHPNQSLWTATVAVVVAAWILAGITVVCAVLWRKNHDRAAFQHP